MDFTLQALKMCWIRALPEPFISVQAKFTQGYKLPDKWESATSVNMLFQATNTGLPYTTSTSLLPKPYHLLQILILAVTRIMAVTRIVVAEVAEAAEAAVD